MRSIALAFILSVLACTTACSGTSSPSGFAGDGTSGGSSGGGSGGGSGQSGNPDGGINLGGGSDAGGNADNCSDAAKLIYVLSSENDLYSFQPLQKHFTKIGTLGCNANGMMPNSMAVDRNAVAWVNYYAASPVTGQAMAGALFQVSTKDASCTPTNIQLPSGWYQVGMGFSTDKAGGTSDTLYVTATGTVGKSNSAGLGKIDLNSKALVKIGNFSGNLTGQSAELTGTGDARLFGFFTTTPVQIAEIDKSSGATSNAKPMTGVETPSSWAFSFWGGDFYLYTAPDQTANPGRTSNVTHYSPSTGQIDTSYMTDVGFHIVGAGVSTCAPVAPPK